MDNGLNMVELLWQGKYDGCGQRNEPERDGYTLHPLATSGAASGCNRLIVGDRAGVLAALAEEYTGAVDLVYLDPPFATGIDFYANGELAYRDTWPDEDRYLQWLYETLKLVYDLLSETGSLYLHLGHHIGHYAKAVMDEVFGRACFQNEIIWHYRTGGASRKRFARKHDTIFFYTKSSVNWVFHPQKQRSYMQHRYGFQKSDFEYDAETGAQYSLVYTRDVWMIPAVGSATRERVGYPTQKPEQLLERIIGASSDPGGLVLDCFCGSGTTGVVAERLGRRWIMSDVSELAIQKTQERLQSVERLKPYVLQTVQKC